MKKTIKKEIGKYLDDLVKDLYSDSGDGIRAIQEPEITSRLCQRMEDKLDGKTIDGYKFHVIAQSLPDRGPQSIEKLIGADLFFSVSLHDEDGDGFDKGIFIQAKYDDNIDIDELKKSFEKMKKTSDKKSSYVWVYTKEGIKVLSEYQAKKITGNNLNGISPRSVSSFTGRILDCYAGSHDWGIQNNTSRRSAVATKLREVRAREILDIQIEKK